MKECYSELFLSKVEHNEKGQLHIHGVQMTIQEYKKDLNITEGLNEVTAGYEYILNKDDLIYTI